MVLMQLAIGGFKMLQNLDWISSRYQYQILLLNLRSRYIVKNNLRNRMSIGMLQNMMMIRFTL